MTWKELDPAEIINSQAFRVINYLIDTKAGELSGILTAFKDRVNQLYDKPEWGGDVNIRVSYEDQTPGRRRQREDYDLPADPNMLVKYLDGDLDRITSLKEQITELGRFKLQLLNDYDFTHGDTSVQEAIFGP